MVAAFRLGVAMCLTTPALPFAGTLSTMRGLLVVVALVRERAVCNKALSMKRRLKAMSTVRGENLSRREPQAGSSMI